MELPIASASLKVRLPGMDCLFSDFRIFPVFRGLLLQLWMLWELMIIGEPLLVIATTPTLCSEAVSALVSIVAPLTVSVDFRPYFTIHDPDFERLNSLKKGQGFPPMVLGVTNLFFLKSLNGIPHVVSVGPGSGVEKQNVSEKRFGPGNFLNAVRMKREGPLSLMTEHKEAVWSRYVGTMKPDTAVLNRLVDAGPAQRIDESMAVVNNDILRRHFVELTTNFLAPFGPYMRAAAPSEDSSPFVDPPPLPTFRVDEFLNRLAERGPGKFLSKRMRSNWLDLYRRFLDGQNFMLWFQSKRTAAEKEQQRLYRHARINVDIHKLIAAMSEVETVDLFNDIERQLLKETQHCETGNADSAAACKKLKGDLQAVFYVLPKDMQQLLLLNPNKAALIRGKKSVGDKSMKFPGHIVVSESPKTPKTP